jgi:flagellin-like hook-associated protein FlgL
MDKETIKQLVDKAKSGTLTQEEKEMLHTEIASVSDKLNILVEDLITTIKEEKSEQK